MLIKPLTWPAETLPLQFNLNSNNEERYRLGKNVGKSKDIAAK
jgi:hypothetical protein